MRIALDAMGGDNAPQAPVKGALQYLQKYDDKHTIVLVGQRAAIEAEIRSSHVKFPESALEIVDTPDVVTMVDTPSRVVKEKADSSLVRGLQMHHDGRADAFISAGSTGAQMAASLFVLGRIKGVHRPAIGTFLPGENGVVLLLDVGATVDTKPENLVQFGVMGANYLSHIYEIENPAIGLLSNGEEVSKGNAVTRQAYSEMTEKLPNFSGYVEGRDIFKNKTDVVVCDGFVGNILLKFAESVFGHISRGFKRQVREGLFSSLGAMLVKPAFRRLRMSYDYQEYGGVPLLGVNGVSVICHGSSTPKAIRNAIRVGVKMCQVQVNEHIRQQIEVIT
jgi:glycerol-3-phosphate acyltransferase PlsX